MSDTPRPSAPSSNARPAQAPTPPPDASPPAKGAARPHTPAEEARDPDEYLETPGSHRRPDGASTDVGA